MNNRSQLEYNRADEVVKKLMVVMFKSNYQSWKEENEMNEKTVKEQLQAELANLQSIVDEVKLQMNLGAKEAQDKIQPHLEELEQELRQAKEKWNEFESSSESAWEDIQTGLRKSLKSMQQAFEKAKKHFPE